MKLIDFAEGLRNASYVSRDTAMYEALTKLVNNAKAEGFSDVNALTSYIQCQAVTNITATVNSAFFIEQASNTRYPMTPSKANLVVGVGANGKALSGDDGSGIFNTPTSISNIKNPVGGSLMVLRLVLASAISPFMSGSSYQLGFDVDFIVHYTDLQSQAQQIILKLPKSIEMAEDCLVHMITGDGENSVIGSNVNNSILVCDYVVGGDGRAYAVADVVNEVVLAPMTLSDLQMGNL